MRNKKIVVCLSIVTGFLFTNTLKAQEIHIVKMRETLSSIAHEYHITVGDLMRFNNLNSKSKLQIGERIKIPSKHQVKEVVKEEKKPVEKQAKVVKTKEEVLPPPAQTHIVEQGESLFRISQKYKVPVAKLREWNNLPDYTIKIGQELFVTKPTDDEVKALQPAKPSVETNETKTVVVKKIEKPVEETPKPVEYKIEPDPVAVTPSAPTKAVVVEETKVQPVEVNKAEPIVKAVDVPKQVKTGVPVAATDQGFFAKQFVSSQQEVTGTAGILKTSSGWLDKKYYVLMNNINPGTIVKITYNNNSVYAKVLEALPDVKEDQGLVLRISNAAASVLNITDNKFPVTVDY